MFAASAVGNRAGVYEDYKSVVELTGHAENGQKVFLKACANCHRLDREGTPVGPDLFGIRNQPKEAILLHILIPEFEITPGFRRLPGRNHRRPDSGRLAGRRNGDADHVASRAGSRRNGAAQRYRVAYAQQTIAHAPGTGKNDEPAGYGRPAGLSERRRSNAVAAPVHPRDPRIQTPTSTTTFLKRTPAMNRRFRCILVVAVIGLLAAPFRPGRRAGAARCSRPALPSATSRPKWAWSSPAATEKQFHKTFHDACKVRAAVFDDGKTRVAIVGIDALGIRRPSVAAARKAIQEQCGIEPDHVMISASHSHSAGPTGMVLPGEFDDAPPLIRTLAYEKSSMANADYLARVEREIVAAVVAADASRARGHVRRRVGHGERGGLQSPLPHAERPHGDPSRPGQSRHRRAGRPDRSDGRRDRRLGCRRQADRRDRQFRLPCHDRPGRNFGRLDLLPRKDDSRTDGRAGRGRLHERRRRRRDPGRQSQSLSRSSNSARSTAGWSAAGSGPKR